MSDIEKIVRLAARGDGVTESGRFVPGAVPGDIVRGEVVEPGPHRAAPPCRHFGACGGCQLQHADEWTLGAFVEGRILGALAGAGIAPEIAHAAHMSPPFSRRRASLRVMADKNGLRIGFNIEGSAEIIGIEECHVVTPRLWRAVEALRPYLATVLRRGQAAGIALTETRAGLDLVFSNIRIAPQVLPALTEFARANGVARISTDEGDTVMQLAEPSVTFGGVEVGFPPGAFLQATADGEAALQGAVLKACAGARRVADLFSGLGTFALPLSQQAKVLAADAAGPAIAALAKAAAGARRPLETAHRDLCRRPLTPAELKGFDAVVLDPPRAGARAQAEQLAKSSVPTIAYVSCNPNTFARDAKILVEEGYRLMELWPVGQFRWSTHVELVAAFRR
jgi:23S rRNA (uracil1939-C5)-methyltransferase